MRYFSIIFAFVIIVSCLIVLRAEADTRYVVDELVITLRQGKSTEHKILKTLRTGTPLKVLEDGEQYLRVRTTDGIEGYVLRQYISSKTPKTQRIKQLEIDNNGLKNQVSELENKRNHLETQLKGIQEKYDREFSDLTAKSADFEQNLEQALANERVITEKYNTLFAQAENVIKIAKERDRLLQKNKKLASGIKELQDKNEKIVDSKMIKWFLAGGGVFFFGWIIGRISRKKRSRY
jgi:SH3 domain protein